MTIATILIVDDEIDVLRAWQRALTMAGHNVEIAQTANAALALCDEHAFDAVVLDYVMPTMNGIELLTRIRKRRPLIRSILISGKLDESVEEDRLTAELKEKVEVDVYLHKPVSNDRLKETIRGLLREPAADDWKEIAEKTVKAKKSRIAQAKETTKRLDQLKDR